MKMKMETANIRRRGLISRLALLPFLAGATADARADEPKKPLKVMFKSAWGSDDPTKAAFPFLHGNALAEAGHTVQIFLLGEGVSLMRSSVAPCRRSGRLAAAGRCAPKYRSKQDSNLCVRRLLSCARHYGCRSHPM